MPEFSNAEIQTVLDQLTNLNAQLTGKAKLAVVTTDLASTRTSIDSAVAAIRQLSTRVVNVQDTLDDLETRVRALEP